MEILVIYNITMNIFQKDLITSNHMTEYYDEVL
jgi:hypothetical protein